MAFQSLKINSNLSSACKVIISGDLKVLGTITSEGMEKLKEEMVVLKKQLETIEHKLDELYYAPGGPVFMEAKTSFENKMQEVLN